MFCTRARAHVRALITQKSCVVGMRNAKPGNHLNGTGQRHDRVQTESQQLQP